MKKIIIILILTLVAIATTLAQQTYQQPQNVDITNDGINPVNITNVSGKNALDVNVVQSVSTGSTGSTTSTVTGTIFISGGTVTANIVTIPTVSVSITNPTTTVGVSNFPIIQAVKTTIASSPTYNQVVVSNIATLITNLNMSRYSLMMRNQGSVSEWIGDLNVTPNNGILLNPNDVIILDRNTAAWYGITSSSTTTTGWLEE